MNATLFSPDSSVRLHGGELIGQLANWQTARFASLEGLLQCARKLQAHGWKVRRIGQYLYWR